MDERNCGFCQPCAEGRYDDCETRAEYDTITKNDLIAFLRDNLSVTVEMERSHWMDSTELSVTVKLKLGEEVISDYTTSEYI